MSSKLAAKKNGPALLLPMGIFDDVIWFSVSLYAHQIRQIQADMDDKDEFSLVFVGVVFLALIRFAQFRKMQ